MCRFFGEGGGGSGSSLSSMGSLWTAGAPYVLYVGRAENYHELKPEHDLVAAGDRMYELIRLRLLPCLCYVAFCCVRWWTPKSCCLARILEPQRRALSRAGCPLLHTALGGFPSIVRSCDMPGEDSALILFLG